ncbi:MAG: RNA 2',3'-cyclic phosphodiesterase [Candidatus Aureabacteria bacterium]|nr:RNA 2',3'-cyclic phosphodiesterase [Candidatus Auribacterota bacterium]
MIKRTFFAFPLTREFVTYYEKAVYPFLSLKELRPVKPENGHITLKFLGPTQEEIIPDILKKAEERLKGEVSFSTRLKGFGVFPNKKRARVLWLGFDDSEGKMRKIAGEVDKALERFGYKRELRLFQPHMTIARVKKTLTPESCERIQKKIEEKMYVEKIKIDMITFFESVLTPQGPNYNTLYRIPLELMS